MNSELELVNEQLFCRLKNRNSQSVMDLYLLTSDYEVFRDLIVSSGSENYSQILLKTGRALTNISDDIVKSSFFSDLMINSTADELHGKEIVFLGYRGGLCNRLRAICSLKVISDALNVKFEYTWSENLFCKGNMPLSAVNIIPIRCLLFKKLYGLSEPVVCNEPLSPWLFHQKFKFIPEISSWIDFKQKYALESKRMLSEILSLSSLKVLYDDFIVSHCLNNYTALHIRRTDFVSYFSEKYPTEKLPEINDYIDYVSSELEGRKFFLSTDDISVRNRFEMEFPNQVCFIDLKFEENELRQTSFSHSLLDLAVLSNASRLVVTPHSSFSDYAITVSNAEIIRL